MNPKHDRFKGASWYKEYGETVIVGGAGGIGSWVCLFLTRSGFQAYPIDDDIIEEHNLGGQFYMVNGIGKKKVQGLQEAITTVTGKAIAYQDDRVEFGSISGYYVISAFDNIQARKDMFANWKNLYSDAMDAIYIDGRLEAEQLWIYCVQGGNQEAIDAYSKLLKDFGDKELPEADCTFKQTTHAAAMIASHIVGYLTNHVANIVAEEERVIPYKSTYFIPLNLWEYEYKNTSVTT